MKDEEKITALLSRSADPARALDIAIKLALQFIAPPSPLTADVADGVPEVL
jgi:hypothetical protein